MVWRTLPVVQSLWVAGDGKHWENEWARTSLVQDEEVRRTQDQRGPGLSQWIIQGNSPSTAGISTGCYGTQKDAEYSRKKPVSSSCPTAAAIICRPSSARRRHCGEKGTGEPPWYSPERGSLNIAGNDYLKESLKWETQLPSVVSLSFPSSTRLETPEQDEVSFR